MPTTLLLLLGDGWAFAAGLMLVLWLLQVFRRDASVVDVGWAYAVGGLVLYFAASTEGDGVRRGVVACLGSVWAFRLGTYLLLNRVLGKPEDGRYQALRNRWGTKAHAGFFLFFQAQALLAVVFASPMLLAMADDTPFGTLADGLGVAIWLTALVGEAIADGQLARFRANPVNRGHVCQVGLWRYSRHPNYFFEWLHWWAYPLLALGSPWVFITLVPLVLMLFFLFKVTGIPYTEKQALKSRGEAYRQYQQTTSVFFPWPPRKLPT